MMMQTRYAAVAWPVACWHELGRAPVACARCALATLQHIIKACTGLPLQAATGSGAAGVDAEHRAGALSEDFFPDEGATTT